MTLCVVFLQLTDDFFVAAVFCQQYNSQHKEMTKILQFNIQVADGDDDHSWWGRPEDNHQYRPAFWIGAGKPKGGADVAGSTAAALALGSVVFKSGKFWKFLARMKHDI